MIGDRYSGDSIAAEFLRLVNKNAPQAQPEVQHQKTASLTAEDDDILNAKASDFIVDSNHSDESRSVGDLENKIEDFVADGEVLVDELGHKEASDDDGDLRASKVSGDDSEAKIEIVADKKTLRILEGLGKIANSLRSKNEGFAADVVYTTAMSIKKDAMNEAHKKAAVTSELNKVASNLQDDGKFFASDLVLATIDKILKS